MSTELANGDDIGLAEKQTGASYKERLEMRKKAQETHRRQAKLLQNKEKLEKSVVYSRDKLYSSLTQFKYIDMFSNNLDEADVKFKVPPRRGSG